MAVEWVAVLRVALEPLKAVLRRFGRAMDKEKYKQLLKAAIAELLQLDPDINGAEANIKAAEALGMPPSAEMLNAQDMLTKVKTHRADWGRKKHGAKKSRRKKSTKVKDREPKKVRRKTKRTTTKKRHR